MKIVIHCTTNTIGTDSWEFVEVEDSITEEELNDLAYEYALSNAEGYSIYPPSDSSGWDEEDDEEADDSIEGTWYLYDPKLHDMYIRNGIVDWRTV